MSELERVESELQAAERELSGLGAAIAPQAERLAVVEAALSNGHTAALEAEAHQLRQVVGKRPVGLGGTTTRISQLKAQRDNIQRRARELAYQAQARRRDAARLDAEIAVVPAQLELVIGRRESIAGDLAKIDAARCALIGVTFAGEARQREVASLKSLQV